MASYRIHRLKEHLQQNFRTAPHVSGVAHVKPRDYEPGPWPEGMAEDLKVFEGETCEAPTPYAAYFQLREAGAALIPGDLLEGVDGSLRIFKYVGFEPAEWVYPEPKNLEAKISDANPAAGARKQAVLDSQPAV